LQLMHRGAQSTQGLLRVKRQMPVK
jgi:hypothetical protein